MELVSPELIEKIDKFAEENLNIPQIELMGRSASAAFCALEKRALDSDRVVILCGKGNNGGDGYALALLAMKKYNVTAVDVFGSGQRSEAGQYYLNKYANSGGNIISGLCDLSFLDRADVIVDAIFGTGMRGECPSELSELVERINGSGKKVIAIDIPLGVNSYDGSVSNFTLKADITVVLSFMKIGTVSYPAREFLGEIVFSDLELPKERIISQFQIKDHLTDASLVRKILGQRGKNTNKGSFGKALLITGSDRYEGAGRLSLEAALRGGAGIVGYCSSYALRDRMIKDFPEAIYYPLTDEDFNGR